MYHETAYFASDYQTEIESLSNPAKMAQQGKIVQFDFVGPVSTKASLLLAFDSSSGSQSRLPRGIADGLVPCPAPRPKLSKRPKKN
jgi:hypothetical protein